MSLRGRPPRHPRGRQVVRRHAGAARGIGRDPGRLRSRLRRRERSRQVHPRQDRRRGHPAGRGPARPQGRAGQLRVAAPGARAGYRARRPGGRARPAANRRGERLPGRRAAPVRLRPAAGPPRAVRARRRLRPASRSLRTQSSGALPLAKQQQVEILRALSRDAELIVFDEPTAALSAGEVRRFHEIVRGLAASGRTVVLVSPFPRRGPRAGRHGHDPPRRPGRQDGARRRRDRGHAGRGDARPIGRPDVPAKVMPAGGCADRADRQGPHGGRRRRGVARRPGGRDRRSRRPRRRGPLGAGAGDLRGRPGDSVAVDRRHDAAARHAARLDPREGHDDSGVAQGRGAPAPEAGPGECQPRQPGQPRTLRVRPPATRVAPSAWSA